MDDILLMAKELVVDKSGNYVCQSILKNGKTRHKKKLINIIMDNLLEYSTNKYASNVIECCIKFSSNSQRKDIAKTFMNVSKDGICSLEMLLLDKFGNYVLKNLLQRADKNDLKLMTSKLKELIKKKKQLRPNAKIVLKTLKNNCFF